MHDAAEPDRLRRFRNVEPETAVLIAFLIRCMHALTVLEIGTSNGYSTIWLSDAAETVGGTVTSVDIDPERTGTARENLRRAGLRADLPTEDAADTLRRSGDGQWEFIFLDAERPAYAGYWPELLRTLRPREGRARDRQRPLSSGRGRRHNRTRRGRAHRRDRACPDRGWATARAAQLRPRMANQLA